MGGVRIVLKGLHDTFEHMLTYTLVTLTWWLGLLLIVAAPPATVALFAQTDPRNGTQRERRTWGEEMAFVRERFSRSWGVALMTVPLIVVLVINLATLRAGESRFGYLVPVWIFMLLVWTFIAAGAFAGVALLDRSAVGAVKHSALMTAAHLPRVLIVGILLSFLSVISLVLVVPIVMFLPATIAATMNRFVLDAYKVEVIDPLAPTEERRREEAARKSSKFGP
jgi:uncharacterized membrane protein YesL